MTAVAPSDSPKPMVQMHGINKWYGDYHALRDIDLQVTQGERIVVCGPSGSGKSTLVRTVNLLEPFQLGRLQVCGITVGADAITRAARLALNRQVGMVFQQFNLFPHMTALGNVMEGLRTVKGVARDAAQTQALAQLARVGLADKADAYPARLSGGQKQRVAIARALAMEPELLLFDEPTSALDPELVGEVLRVIRTLAEEGRTMLLVTHELGFAYHFANRILFIADGVIHEDGTPDQVLKHPRQARTQAFLARHNEFHF